MRKTAAVIISSLILCLAFSSCGKTMPFNTVNPEEASKVEQVLSLMTLSENAGLPVYSELKNHEKYLGYFDLIIWQDSDYLLLNINGENYIFMIYKCPSTTEHLDKINGVDVDFSGDTMMLTFDTATSYKEPAGCFPGLDKARCILKADKGFDPKKHNVHVPGTYGFLSKYDGGVLKVEDRFGFVDADLNFKLPLVYNAINEFDTDKVDHYYYTARDRNLGLIDNNGDFVLSEKYSSIVCIDEDRFFVEKEEDGKSMLGIVDSNEKPVKDYIPGSIEMQSTLSGNYVNQYIYSCETADGWKKGVVDGDLNIIIKPEYEEIAEYEFDSPKVYYAVKNSRGKTAVIGNDGELKTGFDYDEMYDASEAYIASMGGRGAFYG